MWGCFMVFIAMAEFHPCRVSFVSFVCTLRKPAVIVSLRMPGSLLCWGIEEENLLRQNFKVNRVIAHAMLQVTSIP